ncbi:MAG: methyltransferase [Phycisphaerae bacterium]
MTSRERVLAAIEHREPDRLPIDCGAMRSTGIQAIAYNRLKAHLGIKGGHTRVFDVIQQLAEPEPFYLDRFRIDAINAGREFAGDDKWKPWTLPDGSPCEVPASLELRTEGEDWLACNAGRPLARMIGGSTYFSQAHFPLADDDWMDRLPKLPQQMGSVCWGALAEPIYEGGLSNENLERIGRHVAGLRASSDRAIMIAFGANLFEWASYLRRMDNFLLDLAGEPAAAEALLDKLVEIHLAGLDRLLPVLGENVDLIQLGDDLGMQSGPFFSPEMFRHFFKPRYRTIIERIRRHCPKMAVFLHCCGSVYEYIPDLIEVGFQVLNPVQIGARNMEPQRLKKEFGRDLTFWGGGCDTQHVLSRGTPQEVWDHVRRNIEILAPGGGFVFNQVHNTLGEVPP